MASKGTIPVTHVVFGMSAAGSLKRALEQIACNERVIGLPDDLSFGPINPPETRLLTEWIDAELGYESWAPFGKLAERFWKQAVSSRTFPVAWFSRRCTFEYCGFLEFACRMDAKPFGVIDVTDMEFATAPAGSGPPEKYKVDSFNVVPHQQIVDAQLIGNHKRLDPQELQTYREIWSRLKSENAPLRVFGSSGLYSAPLDHFDEMLMSLVTKDWQKTARVVGEALGKCLEGGVRQCGDLLLSSRLHTLAENKIVEL